MKPGLKRGLKIAAVVLVLVLAFPVVAIGSAFAGKSAIEDGAELTPAVRIVKDGYVLLGVVDVGEGKVALVDGGNDPTGKSVLAELTRRKLGPEAVSAVFVTHGHPDHIAACHLFPAASIYALAADVGLAEGTATAKSPVGKLMGAQRTGTKITRGLTDGETVTVGSRAVQVFAVPGHTAGSAAYLVDGVLFLGDSASATSDGKITGAPWFFSDDQPQNRASLKALGERLRPRQSDVKVLVPAHTGVLRGLAPLLAFEPG
jgi:glyoxylase-like metal-dependent hydrolase (beta-lactamase superfamily II)